jgi:hypothetical protein
VCAEFLLKPYLPLIVSLEMFGYGFFFFFFFLNTLFTLCPFETKRRSIFYFWTGNVFPTGQVFFVPEWPKGEFVSILCLLHSG